MDCEAAGITKGGGGSVDLREQVLKIYVKKCQVLQTHNKHMTLGIPKLLYEINVKFNVKIVLKS